MTLFDPASLEKVEAGAGAGETDERPRGGVESGPRTGQHATAAEVVTRLRLDVAYDGSGFRGFAAQEGQRTVAGELRRAIATAVRHEVDLVCAGRTDAGVHATGQVVHVDVRGGVAPERLVKAVNAMIGPEVVIRRAAEAPEGFDARRSARARHYRYLVLRADTPDPLLARISWHVRDHLETRSMSAAADALLGEHDFSAFCRRPPGAAKGEPITRRVLDASWRTLETDDVDGSCLFRFDISAQSFCHQMVRSILGALVDVGRGRKRASDVTWMLRTGDRSRATTLAPPHGLCLVGVDY